MGDGSWEIGKKNGPKQKRLTLKYQAKILKSSQSLGLPLQSRSDFGT